MKIYKTFLSIFLFLFFTGCTNLDEKVYSDIQKKDFFTSEEFLRIYASRAYTSLQGYCTEQSLWTLNLQTGDEIAAPKNQDGSWAEPRYAELQRHALANLASNKLVRQGWDFCFDGIAACNDVIYEIVSSALEFDGKKNVLAEVCLLRDFFYMMAIDGWGNVPFVIDASQTDYPLQKDRAYVFNFIEHEILEQIRYLDKNPTSLNYGHVTQSMAYTLLAKMYLNAEKWIGRAMWKEAENACCKVMDLGAYAIEDNYSDNFKVKNESSRENIFVIPYSSIYTKTDHNAFIIFILTLDGELAEIFNIPASCWDGFVGQPDFWKSYDAGDLRRDKTWLTGEFKGSNGTFTVDPIMEESAYVEGRKLHEGARIGKWEYQTDGLLKSGQTSMENDFVLFRYSDVVLMWAEALLRQDRGAEAVINSDLIKIRTRAGLEPFSVETLTLDALLAERGHELALEGWRRQDLIRFGKYNDKWWCKPLSSPDAELYPIPRERMGANPNLKQNSGY